MAMAAGYTHLDNAEAYGNEKSVGVALAESGVARESLFSAFNVQHVGKVWWGLMYFLCAVTTKIGTGLSDIRGNFKVRERRDHADPRSSLSSLVQTQLEKLGVSYVDLYLIHWPYEFGKPGYPTHEEAWKVLEELKDEGLAKCVFRSPFGPAQLNRTLRSIGVSNYRISDLEKTLAIARYRPTVNQIELHPYVLKASEPLLAFSALLSFLQQGQH